MPAKTKKNKKTKNLPGIFKKKYSSKGFDKKILKKIYIPEDKKYIKSLFEETEANKKGKKFLAISPDKTFTKQEVQRLKLLAKDIKKQKGRIKLVPLFAVVIFIFACGFGITLTKNIIAKKVIVSVVQSIAKARCDVQSVDIKFLDATFTVKGLEVANKDEPMTNIIQIDKINFDFNLTQLLKAKFIANDMSILGVEFNTERSYDGTLPEKEQKKLKKKEEKKQKEESPFVKNLKAKTSDVLDDAKTSINDMFSKYNPESYINNIYANLQTPGMSETVKAEVEGIIAKYTDLYKALEQEMAEGQQIIDKAMSIDLGAIQSNPLKIKEAVDTIKAASDYATKIKNDAETLSKGIQSDINKVNNLSKNIQNAIKNDQKLVTSEVSKITSFKIDDGKKLLSGTIESFGYQIIGKYYPYVEQGKEYISEQIKKKANEPKAEKKSKNKKEKKESKTAKKRAQGRTITYKGDNYPKLWIKHISGSGGTMTFELKNISSDMDLINTPVTGNFNLIAAGISHKANLIVDARKSSNDALITADYTCGNLDVSYPSSKFGDLPGVPSLDSSKAELSCILKIFEKDGFSITGKSDLTDVKLSTIPFEPKIISDIYQNVLANINKIDLAFTSEFTESKGLIMDISSTIDKQINAALTQEISNQLKVIKEQVQKEATAKINELSNGALEKITSFTALNGDITNKQALANNLKAQIEQKLKDATGISVGGNLNQKKEDVKKEAEEKTKDFLKSLF